VIHRDPSFVVRKWACRLKLFNHACQIRSVRANSPSMSAAEQFDFGVSMEPHLRPDPVQDRENEGNRGRGLSVPVRDESVFAETREVC